MKIDNTPKGIPSSRAQAIKARKGTSVTRNKDENPATDSVDLTSAAAQLNTLEAMLADVSVVDTEKVAWVRQATADGRFKIDPEVIAERLVESIVEGLKRQHKP